MNKLISLFALLLVLLVVPLAGHAHCGGKHTGNHPHCAGGGGGQSNLGDDYTATEGVEFISPSDVGSFDYHIIGTTAQDEIYAGGGKDLIEGGGEQDHIWALGGDDAILVSGGHIYGGTGDDLIIANDDAHNLWGGEGDDIIIIDGNGSGGISGGEGTDWIEGGDGDDWIEFSLGKLIALPDQYDVDYYDGGLGLDELNFSSEEANVESLFVDMALGIYEATAIDPFGTPVTVSGKFFNFEKITGSWGDDVLHGDDTRNGLWSRGGNAIIYGYGGNDAIGAFEGNNVVYGGSGNDRIAPVGDGNDILFGEAGDDFLETNFGDNELHGGEGCDRYIINRESGGTDTIMDFEPACEKIYIGRSSRHSSVEIYAVGNDTIIEFVVKRRMVGTIILKDVTVDESIFIYQRYPDWDCSRVFCGF